MTFWVGHGSTGNGTAVGVLAERVGFEPTVELPRQQFSRLPDSAALAPLRCDGLPMCEPRAGVDKALDDLARAYRARRCFAMASATCFYDRLSPQARKRVRCG